MVWGRKEGKVTWEGLGRAGDVWLRKELRIGYEMELGEGGWGKYCCGECI